MSHYFIGKMVFILTHGKDEEYMKSGMPMKLDTKTIEKVTEYMKHHNLYNKNYRVTVDKGDLHCFGIDEHTTTDFDYNNYMALSPSSAWVQLNFKEGKSGFTTMVVDAAKKTKTTTPYYFE